MADRSHGALKGSRGRPSGHHSSGDGRRSHRPVALGNGHDHERRSHEHSSRGTRSQRDGVSKSYRSTGQGNTRNGLGYDSRDRRESPEPWGGDQYHDSRRRDRVRGGKDLVSGPSSEQRRNQRFQDLADELATSRGYRHTESGRVSVPQLANTVTESVLSDLELSEDEKLLRIMGFKKFRSTKDTKIPGNEFNYAVRKEKQTKYRQYMNRQGGFNRPLSPAR